METHAKFQNSSQSAKTSPKIPSTSEKLEHQQLDSVEYDPRVTENDSRKKEKTCPFDDCRKNHELNNQTKDHFRTQQHQENLIEELENRISSAHTSPTNSIEDINENRVRENYMDTCGSFANKFIGESEKLDYQLIRDGKRCLELERNSKHMKKKSERVCNSYSKLKSEIQYSNFKTRMLEQVVESTKHKYLNFDDVSYDGTFIWRITNVQQKITDAESEQQPSIYSPPFFTSPNGYKACARVYLNGDASARGTHMSLFFSLLRGPNDSALEFPFPFKVSFCLYDQTAQRNHIIDSFRPDIRSSSFQKPNFDLNIASGIPKFCSVDLIKKRSSPYVCENTMFIKIFIDTSGLSRSTLSRFMRLDPGLPTSVQLAIANNQS